MKCPVCEKTLIVVERDKIELDWCHACGGFWFDADEWRLLGFDTFFLNRKEQTQGNLFYIRKEKL